MVPKIAAIPHKYSITLQDLQHPGSLWPGRTDQAASHSCNTPEILTNYSSDTRMHSHKNT